MPMALLCMFNLFIQKKKDLKTCNVKKNNSKCTKFAIKKTRLNPRLG